MKKNICILFLLFIFVGCATIFPVIDGKSKSDYYHMQGNNNPEASCYVSAFRWVPFVLDIIFGVIPLLVDVATGEIKYYSYDPSPSNPEYKACAAAKNASQEPPAPLVNTQEATLNNPQQENETAQPPKTKKVKKIKKVKKKKPQNTNEAENVDIEEW